MNAVRWLVVSVVGAGCATMTARAETVIKDHVSDTIAWSDDFGGLLDHFLDPLPAKSSALAIAITGNGERLARVGVIFAHSSDIGMPDEGDIHELRWRFRFFPDTASFSLAALTTAPPQPNWEAVFDAPSNAGWTTVIGSFLGMFSLRYAEVDVSGLGIVTIAGQTHLVVLIPESRLPVPATIAAIAASGGGGTTIGNEPDWFQRGSALGATGPASLADLQENWTHAAVKVVTVASPSCAPPIAAGADPLSSCPGSPVQLSATPGIGADTIAWFTDACGGMPIGTGTSITANPLVSTTYFARSLDTASGCVSDTCVVVGPVLVHPFVAADLDQDCDVDADDAAQMASCRSGPGVPRAATPACTAADLDADGDVDQSDFAPLQRCYSGPGVPAQPGCGL